MGYGMQAPRVMATDKRRDTGAYWEARLQRMGLGMETGHLDWISYGHVVSDLDFDGRTTYPSTGERSEIATEWPLSLL